MFIRTSGIAFPKNNPNYDRIELDLNRTIRDWTGNMSKMKFYEDMGDHLLIPRFYTISEPTINQTIDGEDIKIKSNIVPRNERQKLSIEFLCNNSHGILRLEPGSGKTVVSIDALTKIGKKAIIFVHKDKLLEQWKKEILLHTDAREEDISRLSTTSYREDLKKPIILSTIQAVISIYKSTTTEEKRKDFIDALQNSNIGVAIFDECHVTTGPEVFTKVSLLMNCSRVFGLSATPTRLDGNEDIIKYHLGEVTYFEPEKSELMPVKIYMVYFPFGCYSKYRKYLTWGGGFELSRYHKQLSKSDTYMDITTKLIHKVYNKNRIILALGTRVDCLLGLAERCKFPKEDVGIFIPSTQVSKNLDKNLSRAKTDGNKKLIDKIKNEINLKQMVEKVSDTCDLDIAFYEKKVVFSTYLASRDGNNRKDLDCLIMTTPTSNVEQAVGRIQRELEGKMNPLVLDLVDTEGPMVKMAGVDCMIPWFIRNSIKREEAYKKLGWKIEKIKLKIKSEEGND